MKTIKEIYTSGQLHIDGERRTCVITEDNYNDSLEKIQRLAAIAQRDFPNLHIDDIHVKVYGGDRRKHMMGIEFMAQPEWDVPADYAYVHVLETTFN